jgi:hypothetical protein
VVTPTNKTRRRWTDATIETELRAVTDELGHFPTRAELAERGLRGLWDAMRASGGVDAWRERAPNAAAQAPAPDAPPGTSHDQIAARAYELYEQGHPGDAEAHWLAAERDLTSEPV